MQRQTVGGDNFTMLFDLPAHSGRVKGRRNRAKSIACHKGENWVNKIDLPQLDNRLPTADVSVFRRALLGGLSLLPIAPLALSGWWMKSSSVVVLRNGWVLSKDD